MIEKSVLHLVSLSPEAVSLAASRLRRATIEISNDADAKHLHSLQRDVPQALALLASSFPIKQTSSSHKTILVWLSRECPKLLCDAIQTACNVKQDSITDSKGGSVTEKNNLLGFQILRYLAATSNQLPNTFVNEILSILGNVVATSTSIGPSAHSLLARDLTLHFCERLTLQSITKGENDVGEVDIIYSHRVIIRNVLQKECDWVRLRNPLLFLGLSNVIDDLSLLIINVGEDGTGSSSSNEETMDDVQTTVNTTLSRIVEEMDDIDTSKVNHSDTKNQAMLDNQGKEFLRNKEIDANSLSLIAQREFSVETIEKASLTLLNAQANTQQAANALRNSCLSLGRFDIAKQQSNNIPLNTIKSLLEGSIRALNDANFSLVHHKMASSILKSAFSLVTSSSSQTDLASKLIPLLDERKDGISIAAAELIAESVHANPTAHLLELDIRLSAKEKHKRENSVLALSKVIELRSQKRWNNHDFEKVDEMLAGMLLKRLGDENIDVRKMASNAFSYINPQLVIPKLCEMLGHQSEKSRSGALEALCGMLKESIDLEKTLECLLRLENIQNQELCFNLANRWVTAITLASDGEERFSILMRVLVRECMSRSKENPLLMGLARRIGRFVAEKRTRQIEYCSFVLKEIDFSSPPDLLVFQRLTPLLLLRVVPKIDLGEQAKFENGLSLRDALMDALQYIVKSSNEEREVRRIACECIAQMVGSPPWLFFLSLLNEHSNEDELKRAAIYGMCHCVVCRIQDKDFGADAIPFVAIQVVLNMLTANQSQNQDYEKLIMGTQEFLALTLVCEGLFEWKKQGHESTLPNNNRRSVVEELTATSSTNNVKQQVTEDAGSQKILSLLMEKLLVEVDDDESPVRNVIAFALSLTARALLPSKIQGQETSAANSMTSRALQAASIKDEDIALAACGFARMIVNQMVSTWSSNRPPRDDEIFVIFNSAFASIKRGKTSFLDPTILNELVKACVTIVQTPSAGKISTLKLIGLLLVLPEKELKSLEEGMLGRMYTALKSLSNVDSDPNTRALASELLKLSFI